MGPSGWQQVGIGVGVGAALTGLAIVLTWPYGAKGIVGLALVIAGLGLAAWSLVAYEIERRVRLRLPRQPTGQVSADWRSILNRWIGEGDRLAPVLRSGPQDTTAVDAWLAAAKADMLTDSYTNARIGALSGPGQAKPSPAERMRHYVEQLRKLLS